MVEPNETLEKCPPASPGALRRELRLAAACLAWAVCFAAVRWVQRDNLLPDGAIVWLVAALPTVAGIVLLVIFTRYLREIDELQRAIQLQAMALGFGGGYLAICAWVTFEPLGAPRGDPLDLLTIMPVLYAIGVLVGTWRYR